MGSLKPITIIGGGLAGLSLGIGLRRRNVPVIIYEAGHYPRHRVCGEFISGRGQGVLDRLGLQSVLREAGAIPAQTVKFRVHKGATPVWRLSWPALCVSRFILDAVLAERFRQVGGELHEGHRWRGEDAPGTVRASGRRAHPVEGRWRWFGLKIHAQNVRLEADLEMHACRDGYVGLCQVGAMEVNVCGCFRRPAAERNLAQPVRELLWGEESSVLRQRLRGAAFDESSNCAVAGLSFSPRQAVASKECCIGDALTMIPPVSGNGMSMALEAAEVALGPLEAYSRSEIAWDVARESIGLNCDSRFAQRLRWARWLHALMFLPVLRHGHAGWILGSQRLFETFFARTR